MELPVEAEGARGGDVARREGVGIPVEGAQREGEVADVAIAQRGLAPAQRALLLPPQGEAGGDGDGDGGGGSQGGAPGAQGAARGGYQGGRRRGVARTRPFVVEVGQVGGGQVAAGLAQLAGTEAAELAGARAAQVVTNQLDGTQPGEVGPRDPLLDALDQAVVREVPEGLAGRSRGGHEQATAAEEVDDGDDRGFGPLGAGIGGLRAGRPARDRDQLGLAARGAQVAAGDQREQEIARDRGVTGRQLTLEHMVEVLGDDLVEPTELRVQRVRDLEGAGGQRLVEHRTGELQVRCVDRGPRAPAEIDREPGGRAREVVDQGGEQGRLDRQPAGGERAGQRVTRGVGAERPEPHDRDTRVDPLRPVEQAREVFLADAEDDGDLRIGGPARQRKVLDDRVGVGRREESGLDLIDDDDEAPLRRCMMVRDGVEDARVVWGDRRSDSVGDAGTARDVDRANPEPGQARRQPRAEQGGLAGSRGRDVDVRNHHIAIDNAEELVAIGFRERRR